MTGAVATSHEESCRGPTGALVPKFGGRSVVTPNKPAGRSARRMRCANRKDRAPGRVGGNLELSCLYELAGRTPGMDDKPEFVDKAITRAASKIEQAMV